MNVIGAIGWLVLAVVLLVMLIVEHIHFIRHTELGRAVAAQKRLIKDLKKSIRNLKKSAKAARQWLDRVR